MHYKKGFTLVELVIVIALMGIMVAVATPRFANGDIFETRGDAGLISSTLRYAQKTAIAQRRQVFVITDTVAQPNSIKLCFVSDPNCPVAQAVIDPETDGPYVMTLSRNVRINPSNNSLGFDGLGQAVPNGAANYVVTNQKNNAQTFTVNIEADTGYIR
ncbi:MAG TPA: prepilin-type N-terminal cleavage/methylation domain-containing protein [Methylophilus sp.]|uniref:pilus assembly FimT family protein n=1 Tax=Methylophilus sp. TaxID=29541 RepID=UPI002C269A99|nr:prepilin-type N-terminal cleavage/methylation domain-containing protein [Methylophilus sp.]HSH88275.1 prepilin-type N-terminal cleavage/methylation domain-containing protein [Methylophilus sp.]